MKQLVSAVVVVVLCTVALTPGCAPAQPINPSFPVTRKQADKALDVMEDDPVWLRRPVVIVGGYYDPGMGVGELYNHLQDAVGDPRVMPVVMGDAENFEQARTKVIEAVQERWPSNDPDQTIPVDVVALSLGNLVTRYAAMDEPLPGVNEGRDKQVPHHPRRLNVVRFFGIAGPHLGASAADNMLSDDPIILGMRHKSEFLEALNARDPQQYDAVYYVRLNDRIVGEENAAPPGRQAYWIPLDPEPEGHLGVQTDPRVLADIARRLRGEPSFVRGAPAPLPTKGK